MCVCVCVCTIHDSLEDHALDSLLLAIILLESLELIIAWSMGTHTIILLKEGRNCLIISENFAPWVRCELQPAKWQAETLSTEVPSSVMYGCVYLFVFCMSIPRNCVQTSNSWMRKFETYEKEIQTNLLNDMNAGRWHEELEVLQY